VFGRAPSCSRFNKIAPLQIFPAKHRSSKNSRSTKSMDLAPNSTKSMECLKGYSAKACFVLTRGVGWKLPTIATHYTTYQFNSFFPKTPSSRDCRLPHATQSPSSSAVAASPPVLSAGPRTPEMSRSPPPPPPPLSYSSRRVGLPHPPPVTLDDSDVNGAAAVGGR
jgi:hypothetical protein